MTSKSYSPSISWIKNADLLDRGGGVSRARPIDF